MGFRVGFFGRFLCWLRGPIVVIITTPSMQSTSPGTILLNDTFPTFMFAWITAYAAVVIAILLGFTLALIKRVKGRIRKAAAYSSARMFYILTRHLRTKCGLAVMIIIAFGIYLFRAHFWFLPSLGLLHIGQAARPYTVSDLLRDAVVAEIE